MELPRIAFIMVFPSMYEVNTITMGKIDEATNPALRLRNDLFGIRNAGETMIWEVEPEDTDKRKDPILHCQRYKTIKATIRGHRAVVNKLIDGKTEFFNGDGFTF